MGATATLEDLYHTGTNERPAVLQVGSLMEDGRRQVVSSKRRGSELFLSEAHICRLRLTLLQVCVLRPVSAAEMETCAGMQKH
jgi:hypothetical protein